MSGNHFEWGTAPVEKASVLVHHLYGAMDAGEAGNLAISQMLSSLSAQRVATFETSRYVDYRSRRPIISVENWCLTDIAIPEIAVDLLTDYSGHQFLVLHGPEPDFHWDEFSQAVLDIARRYEVESVIGLMGMPAGIPHTRSTFVHQTATDELDIPTQPDMPTEIKMTASMGMFVQHWAGQAGLHSIGLVAGIPYYLADSEFPQGGAALIDYLAAMTRLQLPVGDLAAAANKMRNIIDNQISDSEEVMNIVHMIEERYDSSLENMPSQLPGATPDSMADDIPTGEAIASKFQEFFSHVETARSFFTAEMTPLDIKSAKHSKTPIEESSKDSIDSLSSRSHEHSDTDSQSHQHTNTKQHDGADSPSRSHSEQSDKTSSQSTDKNVQDKPRQYSSRKQRREKIVSRRQLRLEREARKGQVPKQDCDG